VRFRFIFAEKASFPVAFMCRRLQVSMSGFYAWCRRPESHRAREDRRLAVLAREAHERGRRAYGSPRVHAELQAQGIAISRKRVIRLMQAAGLRGKTRRKWVKTTDSTHGLPVAPNLLARDSAPALPIAAGWGTSRICGRPRDGSTSRPSSTCTPASSLSALPDGRLAYRMKRPSATGQTHLVMAPVAFLRRVAALVPPPRANLVRYFGVFAPNARVRPRVVPAPAPLAQAPLCPLAPEPVRPPQPRRPIPWAELLKRCLDWFP
jgi:transposase InsO family protein